jgi:hypothetical protein
LPCAKTGSCGSERRLGTSNVSSTNSSHPSNCSPHRTRTTLRLRSQLPQDAAKSNHSYHEPDSRRPGSAANGSHRANEAPRVPRSIGSSAAYEAYRGNEDEAHGEEAHAGAGKLALELNVCTTITDCGYRRRSTAVFHNQLGWQSKSNSNTVNAAHTISQRLRTLRKIPPELVPLGEYRCPWILYHAYTNIVARLRHRVCQYSCARRSTTSLTFSQCRLDCRRLFYGQQALLGQDPTSVAQRRRLRLPSWPLRSLLESL